MINIVITGQTGFIGGHLSNTLRLYKDEFATVPLADELFPDPAALDRVVAAADVIVHLAAVNRHADDSVIYHTNLRLVDDLVASLERTGSRAHVIFSSSTQEERDNPYGRSKREGRLRLAAWAQQVGARFTGLVIPNVFGPFGNPFYNSVIATFSHQLNRGKTPQIEIDAELKLIYVGEVVDAILAVIRTSAENKVSEAVSLPHTKSITVSGILETLLRYREDYLEHGIIPALGDVFEVNLFNTFRGFADPGRYPLKYPSHADHRGVYTELMRSRTPGQVSFSTTVPGVTRGNHFHLRKIERFSVIRGEALIRLRRTGTDHLYEFRLSGSEPAFVDMPVWYTHSITNTGREDLVTVFWSNEFYDPASPDTWFEETAKEEL